MSSTPAITLASTLQSASLNRSPSPTHDLNPSTSASQKVPIRLTSAPSSPTATSPSTTNNPNTSSRNGRRRRAQLNDGGEIGGGGGDRHLSPLPRRSAMPPLPDLRFEQSYLASLRGVTGWGGVMWVTGRDQVLLPLVQGLLWTLALQGWRHWNRSAEVGGRSLGGRVRKWWWGVNGWGVEGEGREEKMAGRVEEFYKEQFGSAAGD